MKHRNDSKGNQLRYAALALLTVVSTPLCAETGTAQGLGIGACQNFCV